MDCSLALLDATEVDDFLARAAAIDVTLEPLALIEGQNYSNGDEMALTLYRASGNAPGTDG